MLIRWLWRKPLWPEMKKTKTKTNTMLCIRAKLMALTQKSLRRQIWTPFNAWTEWKFVICFSLSPSLRNRNIWYIYACQRLIILIAHSNHFDSQNKPYHSIHPRHGFLRSVSLCCDHLSFMLHYAFIIINRIKVVICSIEIKKVRQSA